MGTITEINFPQHFLGIELGTPRLERQEENMRMLTGGGEVCCIHDIAM